MKDTGSTLALLTLLLAAAGGAADTEIYRCATNDGTVAFQAIPCAEIVEEEPEDEARPGDEADATHEDETPDFVNPFDNIEAEPRQPETAPPAPPSQDRRECEKTTRDAIDAIDLEMRSTSYSNEEGRAYLAELRTLTQQLRACKQL